MQGACAFNPCSLCCSPPYNKAGYREHHCQELLAPSKWTATSQEVSDAKVNGEEHQLEHQFRGVRKGQEGCAHERANGPGNEPVARVCFNPPDNADRTHERCDQKGQGG